MPIIPVQNYMQVVERLQARIRELELENARLKRELQLDHEQASIDELGYFAESYTDDFVIVSIDEH